MSKKLRDVNFILNFVFYFVLGIVNKILSLPIFVPLGRICYMVYLIHSLIHYMYVGSTRMYIRGETRALVSNLLQNTILLQNINLYLVDTCFLLRINVRSYGCYYIDNIGDISNLFPFSSNLNT